MHYFLSYMTRHMKASCQSDVKLLSLSCSKCFEGVEHAEHEYEEREYEAKKNNRAQTVNGQNVIVCNECDHEPFESKRLRVTHYKLNHPGVNIFKCKDCEYGTNYLPNLRSHKESMHEKKVLQCTLCDHTSKWNQSLLAHMRVVHGVFQKRSKHFTDGKTFLCEGCGLTTKSKILHDAHKAAPNCDSAPRSVRLDGRVGPPTSRSGRGRPRSYNTKPRNYSEQELKKYKCNQCNYSTDYAANVRLHIQVVHEKNKPFKCEEVGCKFETGTKQNLQVHDNSVHKGIRFTCDVCGHDSPSASYLKIHKEVKHENKFKFKCKKCEYQTYYSSNLKIHLSTHLKKENLQTNLEELPPYQKEIRTPENFKHI